MLSIYNQTSTIPQVQETQNKQAVEVPVAAFPLRGKCNPYIFYLLPLLFLRFLIFLSLLGALICTVIIPKILVNYESETPEAYKSTRVAGIAIYAVSLGFTLTTFLVELLNGCNIADSRYTPIIISFIDLFFSLLITSISIALMIREFQVEQMSGLFTNAIDKNTFLAAGIFGMSAVFFYMMHLFLSRFYQFCIGNYKNFKREFLYGTMSYGNPSITQQQSLSSISRVGMI
ncbi:unnamed protein product [Brachionus calyciflorus]|uniref:Uncharacterized protein n=1 Tax=Brachionus calyciflorus TaxID=104777 RepID=A0A813X557_9BILA|nr:unnamed protein product [Brachionus calyciflorus]